MTTWQFVDSIATSPSVLLDLNASPFFVDVASVDLSPAEYDQSWSSNSLAHGARLAWEKAQNRTLKIPLHIMSSTVSAHETAITNLGNRIAQNGILKVQYGSTPIYFRTFGNPKYAMKIRRALKDSSTINLEIQAEPFGYGPRIEVPNSPFTVSNDPAAGSNGCFFDIVGISGDVSTPLLLVMASTGAGPGLSGVANRWTHIGTRRRGTPSNYSNVVQAEGMTLGTNAAVVSPDTAMSGSSKARITPGTTAMSLRLSDTFPSNGFIGTDVRGQYKVYARVAKVTAGDTWDLQLKYGSSSSSNTANDVQRCPAGLAGPFFLDLGMVPVPAYADPVVHGFSGVELKTGLAWIGVFAQRVAGTGALDIDYLYFMPADDQTLIVRFPGSDLTYAIDGTTDSGGAVYGLSFPAMDEVFTTDVPAQVIGGGGFPEVIPGVTNRIHFLRNIDPNGTVDAVGNTTTIRAYYWPRWREAIRP